MEALLHEAGWAFLRVVLVVLPILILVPGLIWYERRLLSWMQDRIGPNRVATITWSKTSSRVPAFLRGKKWRLWGLLQPIADGVKLFFKEDITPTAADRAIYFIAPAIALFPAFAIGGTMPWGPWTKLTPVADVNIGILYVLAISSLGVYGVVLAGYGSNNKYSLMGGLRASAQLISYELSMGMALAGIALATGSLRMTDMVRSQTEPLWGVVPALQNWNILTPYGFIAGVIFLICMVAETNRAPFDLPEAENELIAGYHTEYSSMKFAVFFMGEYAAMFIFSGIFATVFLGGWNLLPIRFEYYAEMAGHTGIWQLLSNINTYGAPLWFLAKCAFGITVYIWIRGTLPRLRYDQLMTLGWKSLLPIAVSNFIVVALWIAFTATKGPLIGWAAALIAIAICLVFYRIINAREKIFEKRDVRMVDSGRRSIDLVDPGAGQAPEGA